jgi:D-alanyl-lipoteichoic acid acyltransferase DltB (MBOAT superfamily)
VNFNAPEFLLFFPAVLALHWLLPHRLRSRMLLAASWIFYFWWNFWTGFLLVGSTLVSWLCARGIHTFRQKQIKNVLLLTALIAALGSLAIFKYANFFLSAVGLSIPFSIILPVGISFYTFQTLSYVIDVYRGTVEAEENFFDYALFVSFFPQLVAGPIERPENLLPQLKAHRHFSLDHFTAGCRYLLQGYFKKIVVADTIAPIVDAVFLAPEAALGPDVILASMLFGIQIYCDFSGYSDIARGCAKLLGIDLMENFRTPYRALSVRDFWRRWHISLTSWFTDYVYIPLGGNRRGLPRQILHIMLVFLLSGLWHGADWSFVVWGGIHGLYQIGGILWSRSNFEFHLPVWLRQLRTFLLVSFSWLFFRAASLEDAIILLSRLGTTWQTGSVLGLTWESALQLGSVLICLHLIEKLPSGQKRTPAIVAATVFFLITAICIAWLITLSANGQNAFIYFQF